MTHVVPIAKGYSRAFLFARLTRVKHDFKRRTLVFGARGGINGSS